MAARKKAAPKKSGTSALVPVGDGAPLQVASAISDEWREKLAGYAKDDAATATGGSGWKYISTKGGAFTFADEKWDELPPMLMVGTRFDNRFYPGRYDPDNTSGPECFAIAKTEDALAPPDELGDARECRQTNPPSEGCAGCWANAFGSAEEGRGKACKNSRRIALLPADDLSPKALSEVEGAMLRLPVMSVANYSTFANKVTKGLGLPLFAVRVKLGVIPDGKSQYRVTFDLVDVRQDEDGLRPLFITDSAALTTIEERVKEAETYLDSTPSGGGDDENAPKRVSAPKKAARGGRATPRRKSTAKGRKKSTRRAGADKY